jgi:hypothetical protein
LLSLVILLALQTAAQTPRATARKDARAKFADAPSDANHATLDATMKWLKHRLSEDSLSVVRPGRLALHFEPVEFSGCRIKYRYTVAYGQLPDDAGRLPGAAPPTPNDYAAPPTEHRLDLADLDPDSLLFTSSKDEARVLIATRDRAPKITVVTFLDQPSRDLTTKWSFVVFKLKKNDAAPYVRDALAHAVKLCQAQQ